MVYIDAVLFVLLILIIKINVFFFFIDPSFFNCDRQCKPLEWPLICRYIFVVEPYTINYYDFENQQNKNSCDSYCSSYSRERVFLINNEFPAPLINICKGDILLIDIENRIPGKSLSFHWTGQPQTESSFMDGVPLVTQCPIQSYTKFQYKFQATNPGTHLYYAFSGDDRLKGLSGGFIIREPDEKNPLKKYYNHDNSNYTIIFNQSFKNNTILINKKPKNNYKNFIVNYGEKYRFRLGYIGNHDCSINFSIDEHKLQIISFDGFDIDPFIVNDINFNIGERIDFILQANQMKMENYKIKLSSKCWNDFYLLLIYNNNNNKTKINEKFVDYKNTKIKLIRNKFNLETIDKTIYLPIQKKMLIKNPTEGDNTKK